MKINAKILMYFKSHNITMKEIANSYGCSQQQISNMLNRASGAVPLEFITWLAEEHPMINLNDLFHRDKSIVAKNNITNEPMNSLVQDTEVLYGKMFPKKDQILKDISIVLDKYLK